MHLFLLARLFRCGPRPLRESWPHRSSRNHVGFGPGITAAALFLAIALVAIPARAVEPPAYVPGQLLVKYRVTAGQASRRAFELALRARRVRTFQRIGIDHLELERGTRLEKALESFKKSVLVEYAEPDYILKALVVPNDPRFPELYGMRNTGQSGGTIGADIHAELAWDLYNGDPNLKIGVIDTGIDYNHPDLKDNIWTNPAEAAGAPGVDDDGNGYVDDLHGYDVLHHDGDPMDDNGHGTHIAGILAARGNNGLGVVGVAWRAKLVPIKFLDASGQGTTDGAIEALEYAMAAGVRITSNSWGGGGYSQALLDAIEAAGAAGELFVAAAGNASIDTDAIPNYPASYASPSVLSVAATDRQDHLAAFSNFGVNSVDVAAPGVNILSTLPGGNYGELSGTSMAAPHVAGVCALAMGRFPGLSTSQVKNLVLYSVDALPGLAGRVLTSGRVNAHRTIANPDSTPPSAVLDLAVVTTGSTTLGLRWTAPGDDGTSGRASRYEIRRSAAPITSQNFAGATLTSAPIPATAGTIENHEISGLAYATPCYVAIKAFDEFGNASTISNVAIGTTLGAPALAVAPASVSSSLLTGAEKSVTMVLSNTRQGTLDFTVPRPALDIPHAPAQTFTPQLEGLLPAMTKGERDGRVGTPVLDGIGGPDAYGYRWIDSNESGGPAFGWVDITAVGQRVQIFGDDALSNPIPIGFGFPFYGTACSTVRVCTNGYLSFADSMIAIMNQPLPNLGAPGQLLAPLWDDLDFAGAGAAYAHFDGERFIVSWIGVPHFGGGGPYTFQVILHPTGEIRYQYRAVGAPTNQATIGIQNGTRDTGLNIACNASYLHDSLAVRILPLQQWLTVTPSSGRINAGQSLNLTVHFDARLMQGGTYHGAIHVLHNAPGSDRTVPATLQVGGVTDIATSASSIDFGTVYIGATARETLIVINAGSDSLRVDSMSVNHLAYSCPPAAFRLGPAGRKVVVLTYHPGAPGAAAATLHIRSNDPDEGDYPVPLSGQGAPAPDIAVAPDSVGADLPTGGVALRTLTISNSGGSPLPFDIGVVDIGDPEPPRPRSAATALPDRTWPQFEAQTMPLSSPPRPMPQSTGPLPVVVWDPIGDGGAVDLARLNAASGDGALEIELVFAAPIDAADLGGFVSLDVDQDPLTGTTPTYGLPEQDIGAEYQFTLFGIEYGAVDLYDAVTGALVGHYAATSEPTRVRFGVPLADLGGDDGRIDVTGVVGGVSGPTDWFPNGGHGTIAGLGWLTIDPAAGVVPVGGAVQVAVRFDAASLEGGNYVAAVAVRSPDPDEPEVRVGARLGVTAAPDVAVSPDSIDFGTLYPGQTRTDTLRISNLGMLNLVVSSLQVSPPVFTIDPAGFSLAPGATRAVAVRYAPTGAGPSVGSLTVHANDPDQPALQVSVRGQAVLPPDIAFSPALFDTTLEAGQTASRSLVISNTGASPLQLELEVVSDPLSAADPAAPSRTTLASPAATETVLGPAQNSPAPARTLIATEYQGTSLRFGITDYGELMPFAYPTSAEHLAVGSYLSGYTVAYRTGTQDHLAYTGVDVRSSIVPVSYHELLNDAARVQVEVVTLTADSTLEILRRFTFYRSERSLSILSTVRNISGKVVEDVVFKAWADWDVDGDSENDSWDYDPDRHLVVASDQHFVGLASKEVPALMDVFGWNDYASRATTVDVTGPTTGIDGLSILHFDLGDLLPSWSRSISVACGAANDRAGLLEVIDRSAHLSDWLLISPLSSVIPPGGSLDVIAALESAGLAVGDYSAHIVAHSNDPDEPEVSIPVHLHVTAAATAVHDGLAPNVFSLRLAGPNPTPGPARLDLAMPVGGRLDVRVFDVRGALVRLLAQGEREPGTHRLIWDGADDAGHRAAPGIYLVRASAGGRAITRRVALVR